MSQKSRSAAIRARLDHPIVDCDGHLVEVVPHFIDQLEKVAGPKLAHAYRDGLLAGPRWLGGDGLTDADRLHHRRIRGGWWAMPTKNTLDCATPLLPKLLHQRMDELGIDFSVLYPGLGLILPAQSDDEIRQATCRAENAYLAETWGAYRDRMTPAAVIPMHTPQEALAELDFAVGQLGLKAISIPPGVWRPIPSVASAYPEAGWFDNYALDSLYDYDSFFARCRELGVAVTSHGGVGPNLPWYGRSISNHMYNHIGSHAYQQGLLCKALLLGGATRRFPDLNFGFLECGVGWAVNQLADLIGHWEKRNREALPNLDPRNLDRAQFAALLGQYADRPIVGSPETVSVGLLGSADARNGSDEFAELGATSADEIAERFTQTLYFGCEADDPITAWAYDTRRTPRGARFRAIFGSDIGHWDVIDMREVVEEAWELVEHELVSETDFRRFAFEDPVRLHATANPAFFDGTAVEGPARRLLGR